LDFVTTNVVPPQPTVVAAVEQVNDPENRVPGLTKEQKQEMDLAV